MALEAGAHRPEDLWVVVDHQDSTLVHRGTPGELDDDGGSAARLVAHADRAAVRLDDRARDREPEARAGAPLPSHERLEDPFAFLPWDPGAPVCDPYLDAVPPSGSRHRDPPAGRREPRRVLDDVRQCLVDLHEVQRDLREVLSQHQPDVVILEERSGPSHHPLDQLVDRRGRLRWRDRPRPHPRQVHEVADHTIQPPGLLIDRLEQLPAMRAFQGGGFLEQARDRRRDRGERRAEVVGDGREERGAQPVGLRFHARRLGLGSQPHAVDRERDLAGERLDHASLLRAEGRMRGPRDRHDAAELAILHRDRHDLLPAASSSRTRTHLDDGTVRELAADLASGEIEELHDRAGEAPEHVLGRDTGTESGAQVVQQTGLALPALGPGALFEDAGQHGADGRGDGEEHRQRHEIRGLLHRERVERRREEEVQREEGTDRRNEPGHEPSGGGREHHGQHVQQGRGRGRDLGRQECPECDDPRRHEAGHRHSQELRQPAAIDAQRHPASPAGA